MPENHDKSPERALGQWRPMASAPRDGSQILCCTRNADYEITHFHTTTGCWVSKRGFLVEAVGWLPLPKLPEELRRDQALAKDKDRSSSGEHR